MDEKLVIRPAQTTDANAASILIYQTMEHYADRMFGFEDSPRAIEALEHLFANKNNRFSHQFADIVEIEGRVAGLLLSYPGRLMPALELPTASLLLGFYGVINMVRFMAKAIPMAKYKEAEADEYFINNLCVREDLRGGGIGSELMKLAESKANSAGLSKCSLATDLDNVRAQALYKRLGYEIVQAVNPPDLPSGFRDLGFYRMVKVLG